MSSVCRICLAGNTTQHFVIEKQLQSFYEKLTGIKFNSDEDRPRTVCSFCYQKLLRCYTIAQMAVSSEKIFTQLDERGLEVPDEYINSEANKKHHLSVTPVQIMNIDERASKAGSQVPIKEKPQPSIAIQKEASRDPNTLVKVGDCITSLLTSDEDDSQQGNNVEVPFKMNVEQTKPDAPEPDSKVPFICNNCNKIFYIKCELISHIRNKHSQLTGRQYSSPKNTERTSMIKDTIVNIRRAGRCKVCRIIFNRKANFFAHLRTQMCNIPQKQEPEKHPELASPHEGKCIEGNASVMASH